jgi:hypothetical protein
MVASAALNLLFLFASILLALTGVAQDAEASNGYWKFYERVWVEPPLENRHPGYPVKLVPSGDQVTAFCRVPDPAHPSLSLLEEVHKWTWTSPPAVLVPGEKFPFRIQVEVQRPVNKLGNAQFSGGFDAGFGFPKPVGYDQYRQGGDTRKADGSRGNIHLGEFGRHYESGTYTAESFIVIPPKGAYESKEYPGRISFRAGGSYSFGWNTRYEYAWVDGAPPVDRGSAAGAGGTTAAPGSQSHDGTKDRGGAVPGASGTDLGVTETGSGAVSGHALSVLRLITTKWPNSPTNYAKAARDLVFEVGMGSHPRWGYGYAGIELANVRAISAEVLSTPATYAHYDANSFAGFVLHYATSVGNGKRVMLGIGMLDRARWDGSILDQAGIVAPSSIEFVDIGIRTSYDLDLSRWAPSNWNGKVVFAVGLQNAGENNVLRVRIKPR